jgi:phosphatidylglycerophosphatase A
VGFVPVAPGSFGSALGVLVFLPFLALPTAVFAVALLAVVGVGTWAAGVTQEATGVRDDGRIVIDEIAGQLLTLAPLLGPRPGGGRLAAWLVTGFVAFRVLDVWKPGPVGWAERSFGGGLGVMADDLVAGVLGGLLLGAGLVAGGWLS